MVVRLRPESAADEPFLRALFATTRGRELSALGGSPEQAAAFCAMQFAAQRAHYRAAFPAARFDIVELDGVPVGRLCVDRRPGELRIVDVAILPAHRGRGLGTRLLQQLSGEADAALATIHLSVEAHNPARHLYDRLGFVVRTERAPYVEMIRPARRPSRGPGPRRPRRG